MNISINTAGMSNPAAMEFWTQENAYLWDLRTDKDVTYTGTTSATTPSSNEVLVRMATTSEWSSYGGSASTPNAYTVNLGSGQAILLNPYVSISGAHDELLKHELGHTLGYFNILTGVHSPDTDDMMYPTVGIGNFPISTADALGVINFSSLPSVDTADLTSTYMRGDMDLFVPDVLFNGGRYQAQLDSQGPVNLGAGAKDTWRLHSFTLNEEAFGSAATYVNSAGTEVFIHSVQSSGQDYINASMSIVVVGSDTFLQLDAITLA